VNIRRHGPQQKEYLQVAEAEREWTVTNAGVGDGQGMPTAKPYDPNRPALEGPRTHSAFVTWNEASRSGVSNISNTFMFTIR